MPCSHHEVNSLRNILIHGHNTDVIHTCNWLLFLLELTLNRDGTWYAEVSKEINNNKDKLNVNWTYRILIGAVWRTAPIMLSTHSCISLQIIGTPAPGILLFSVGITLPERQGSTSEGSTLFLSRGLRLRRVGHGCRDIVCPSLAHTRVRTYHD